MKNHYRNTFPIAYLLFCLFIASSSSGSFIQQFTDDFNTTLQQEEGTGPNPIRGEAHHLHKTQEVFSRNPKVSASTTVKGLRDRPPSSYSLKMESFNTLLKSTYPLYYETRPFVVGGYSWTLIVYPNGNQRDGGSGYLSLYVTIDSKTLAPKQEVYADLRFYIFNKNERKYFTIQDTDVWRFDALKTMWGFSQALALDTLKDPKNGYLYDGNHCEFGVDVIIPSLYEKSEVLSLNDYFPNPIPTWKIRSFSKQLKSVYYSDTFSIGGLNWYMEVCPSGCGKGEGKAVSMYLLLEGKQKFKPYDKIFVRAKLQVINQRKLSNYERELNVWYKDLGYGGSYGWGSNEFFPFSELQDSSKGFLVNDELKVQVEMLLMSSTKYLPS